MKNDGHESTLTGRWPWPWFRSVSESARRERACVCVWLRRRQLRDALIVLSVQCRRRRS
jgi:hypothetical protein